MSRLIGENLRKSYFIFFNYLPLQILTLKICNCDISKSIIARSFKLGQLILDGEWNTWCKFKKKLFYFYAPNFEKVGSILVSACACVRACVRASVRPSVRSKRNSS